VVHVASSRRSRGSRGKDGQFNGIGCGAAEVGPNYPSLVVIFLIAHRGILVFWFLLQIEPHGYCGRHPSSTPFALGFYFC
jgi:hypothetical protein